jgi:hypothetical protein
MLSRPSNLPLAQGQNGQNKPGGRVDQEEKPRIDNTAILLEMGGILKVLRKGCG